MLNEDIRSVLLKRELSSRYESTVRNKIQRLIDKPISFDNLLDNQQLSVISLWIVALYELEAYHQLPWKLLKEESKGIVFGLPRQSEDAQWRPGSILFLATKDAGYNKRHMLKSIVHELGHALEEKFEVNVDRSIYGKPPFANNYSYTNPVEDFAESFMLYELEPMFLQRVAPNKFKDMSRRCKSLIEL